MTNEELDEARAKEAVRLFDNVEDSYSLVGHGRVAIATIAARLAREGWTPPEPEVDPDVLAFRGWVKKIRSAPAIIPDSDIDAGKYDSRLEGHAYLAGARMATVREQERAKVLVEYVGFHTNWTNAYLPVDAAVAAQTALAKYRGEA